MHVLFFHLLLLLLHHMFTHLLLLLLHHMFTHLLLLHYTHLRFIGDALLLLFLLALALALLVSSAALLFLFCLESNDSTDNATSFDITMLLSLSEVSKASEINIKD
jgi:hypothetical protein